MGLFDKLKKALIPPNLGPAIVGVRAASPSLDYPKPATAFAFVLSAFEASPRRDDHWCTFEARDPGRAATVQYAASGINTLSEEFDLGAMLASAGLSDLASRTRGVGPGLHTIEGATPAELADAVDAIFVVHFGFRPGYEATAVVE